MTGDVSSLHDMAVQAADSLSQLTVGLAHLNANPQIVQQLQGMTQMLHEITSALAQAPTVDHAASQAVAPGGPQTPPQAPPGASPQQPPQQQGGNPPPGPAESIATATQHLHKAMIASAEQRGRLGQ
jgi:hypothetical protein